MLVAASIGKAENILLSIDKYKPGLVILDFGEISQHSLQNVKLSKKNFPQIKLIVMNILPLQSDIFEYIRAGASGFILKDANTVEFIKTIRSVIMGEMILPEQLTGSLFSQITENAINEVKPFEIVESIFMTKRERQVIDLIAESASNKEIAFKLNLSIYTIKSHVHKILEKLAISKRVQIAKHAHQLESYKLKRETTLFTSE